MPLRAESAEAIQPRASSGGPGASERRPGLWRAGRCALKVALVTHRRRSIPHVPFVVGNPVPLKKTPELALEIFDAMVFLLVTDIFDDLSHG